MGRLTPALLLTGCITLQVWAQAMHGQSPPKQTSLVEQESGDQNRPPNPQPDAFLASPAVQTTATQPVRTGFPLDQFQEFSAIMNGSILPASDWDGHIYRSGKLMRLQRDTRVPSYLVTDLEKQEEYGVAANGCIRLNTPSSRSFPFFLSGPGYKYERVPVGEEAVDGHLCRVEDIKIDAPKNPQQLKIRLWEAEDLQGFPIKIENRRENARRWSIHYKNVVLGPQDPTLFIIPNKCQSTADFKALKEAPPTSKASKKAPAEKPQ